MSSWFLNRLGQREHLFADFCGHLIILSLALGALLVTEVVNRMLGALGWWGYFLIWLAAFIAFLWIAALRCARTFARCLDLANARFPTPDLLQRGYEWIDQWIESKRKYISILLPVTIALIVVNLFGMLEERDLGIPHARSTLAFGCIPSTAGLHSVVGLYNDLVGVTLDQPSGERHAIACPKGDLFVVQTEICRIVINRRLAALDNRIR